MRQIEAQLIHDMTNTATVIRGAADTLTASARTMPAQTLEDIAAVIGRRTGMLIRLLEDLALVNALDRGDLELQMQPVQLAETLGDVVEDSRSRITGSLSVDIEPRAVALTDPFRLAQIVDNLLSNAARYGGPHVALRAWTEGRVVRIAVSDDGTGVPPELVDSLFDLYTRGTTARDLGGSGLGLAIVDQLCRASGGSIVYEAGAGATFTATLPAVPTTVVPPTGRDVARDGHTVAFWVEESSLIDSVVDYVAAGLVQGQGVLIAVTGTHREQVEAGLAGRGFDVPAAVEVGQLVALDAAEIRDALVHDGHIDEERFLALVGAAVRSADARWLRVRAFGEIVDLYWRNGESHLSLELEGCWNRLRDEVEFPLFCGYEVAPGQDQVCEAHDAALVA